MEYVNEVIESNLSHEHCLRLIEKSQLRTEPLPVMTFKECCELLYKGITATKIDFEDPSKHMFVTLKLSKEHNKMTYK